MVICLVRILRLRLLFRANTTVLREARHRKTPFATRQMIICLVGFLCLRLLFRAKATVLREANVISPALRESKFALARPLFAGAVL